MSKRKVALVYDAIYPYVKGGGERRFYEIGKRLVDKNTEVHLYGMKYWDGPDVIELDGLILHGIMKSRPLYNADGKRSISQALLFGLACFKLLGAKFDVIDCCGFPYFSLISCKFVAIMRRKPLFTTWHEVWGKDYWKEYMGALGIIGYAVEVISARLPNRIITNIESVAIRLKKELHVKQPITVIGNGINTDIIESANSASKAHDVIYAGRLVQHKNVDYIVRAIAQLKKDGSIRTCGVIGEGPMLASLKKLAEKLDVSNQITWYGFMEEQKEVYSIMKAAKVFVLPSSREGFGIVVIEANACGLPVITVNETANAAVALIKEGINGAIVALEVKAIATKIDALCERPKKDYAKLVSLFSWDYFSAMISHEYSL